MIINMSPMFTVVSWFILHIPRTTLSYHPLTFNPRSVQDVWSEPPLGQVLAGDALPVLVVVTNTLVGEQADWQHHHTWREMQWESSYFDQETRVGWFSTYDGCNDEDGNEDPVPIPGCWGSSNKFLKQLLYLTSEWGKKRFLFLLPVDRDTHIYFSSNLRHPPCALCGSNLIIFFINSYFQCQGRGRSENIMMLFGPS